MSQLTEITPVYDEGGDKKLRADLAIIAEWIRPGSKVLDVATGTGVAAIAFAQAVRPGGRVTAVDISADMLDRAAANITKMALDNVDLHQMDAERLDFRAGYFHSVVCSYGLFFLPDMPAALREWVRVLRPGGKLAFTSFETSAFQPMLDDFVARLHQRVADDQLGRVAGRHRQRPPMHAVKAVAVQIGRQPGGASDAGDEDDVLPRDAELGQKPLDGGQDGVVPASGAPANLLVAGEVLAGQRHRGGCRGAAGDL